MTSFTHHFRISVCPPQVIRGLGQDGLQQKPNSIHSCDNVPYAHPNVPRYSRNKNVHHGSGSWSVYAIEVGPNNKGLCLSPLVQTRHKADRVHEIENDDENDQPMDSILEHYKSCIVLQHDR